MDEQLKRKGTRFGQRGAALIESALTLPLFLGCIFSIVHYGGMIGSVSEVSRTAFEAARAAGESQRSLASARAIGVAQNLFSMQAGSGQGSQTEARRVFEPQFNDQARTVSVRIEMDVAPLLPYAPSLISTRIVSPLLTLGVVNNQSLGEFSDGPCITAGNGYDAQGNCTVISDDEEAEPEIVIPAIPPSKEGDLVSGISKNSAVKIISDDPLSTLPDLGNEAGGGGVKPGFPTIPKKP